jgi:hypothetical protein
MDDHAADTPVVSSHEAASPHQVTTDDSTGPSLPPTSSIVPQAPSNLYASKRTMILVPFPFQTLPWVILIAAIVTICFLFSTFFIVGQESSRQIPWVSTTGAKDPAAVFFRLGFAVAAFCQLVITVVVSMYYVQMNRSLNGNNESMVIASFVFGMICTLCLLLLTIVSLAESFILHAAYASVFFAGSFAQCAVYYVMEVRHLRLFHNVPPASSIYNHITATECSWLRWRLGCLAVSFSGVILYVLVIPIIRVGLLRCKDQQGCYGLWSINVVFQYVAILALLLYAVSFFPLLSRTKVYLEWDIVNIAPR